MRSYQIEVGEYYRVSPPDGPVTVGKVLEHVERRDEQANHRFVVEITEGKQRGETYELTSRRIRGLASEEGDSLPKVSKSRHPATQGMIFDITMKLQVPMSDLPSIMEVLQDYNPEIATINATTK